jgi:cytoskeletal protein CcmA (bactofilin family)
MSESAPNFLSEDVQIKGTVVFASELIMHGHIDGDVTTTGTLVLGPTGTVEGDIVAATASIHGEVNGNVTTSALCELRGHAQLSGDLEAPRLVMDDGATFIGKCNVSPRNMSKATSMPASKEAPGKPVQKAG